MIDSKVLVRKCGNFSITPVKGKEDAARLALTHEGKWSQFILLILDIANRTAK